MVPQVQAENPSLDIARYGRVLKRRWYVVAFMTVLGLVAGVAYLGLASKSVTATTQVSINVISSDSFNSTRQPSALLDAVTEQQLAESSFVVKKVVKALGGTKTASDVRSSMSATLLVGSTVMRITFTAANPTNARLGADTIATSYLDYRSQQASDRQSAVLDKLGKIRDGLLKQLVKVNQTLTNPLATTTAKAQANSDRQSINAELDNVIAQIAALHGVDTSGGSVLTDSAGQGVSMSPGKKIVLVTGGLVGFLIGLISTFVVNRMNRRVYDEHDVLLAGGSTVLARLKDKRAHIPQRGADLEALRVARERLLADTRDRKILAVIDDTLGAVPSDVAFNLAVMVAETDLTVELVMAEYSDGFVDDVIDRLELSSTSREGHGEFFKSARIPALTVRVLPADPGAIEPESAGTIRDIAGQGALVPDLTIITLPPTSGRGSRIAAGRKARAVVVVASAKRAKFDSLVDTVEQMNAVGAVVEGVILVRSRRALVSLGGTASERRRPAEDQRGAWQGNAEKSPASPKLPPGQKPSAESHSGRNGGR